MNILTDRLPESVVLRGKAYPINADFKTAVDIICFAGKESGVKLLIYALKKFYKTLPESLELAVEGFKSFYGQAENGGEGKGLFSFEKDAHFIYSSFYSRYKIDLTAENLHWYVFSALLKGLSGDNAFSRILSLRTLDTSKIRDREKQRRLEALKQKVSLSGEITLEQGLEEVF